MLWLEKIRNQGPETSISCFPDKILCQSVWISIKLFYNVSYKNRKVGIDSGARIMKFLMAGHKSGLLNMCFHQFYILVKCQFLISNCRFESIVTVLSLVRIFSIITLWVKICINFDCCIHMSKFLCVTCMVAWSCTLLCIQICKEIFLVVLKFIWGNEGIK